MTGSPFLAFSRLMIIGCVMLILSPFQAIWIISRLPGNQILIGVFSSIACRVFGIKVKLQGVVCAHKPVLFVSNHSSYWDMFIFRTLAHGRFVAKADMLRWPVLGWLTRLFHPIYVNRRRAHISAHKNHLQTALDRGENVILFPEGTSNDAVRVLPFKTALFAVAAQKDSQHECMVQPVSISYIALDGIRMEKWLKPCYAWYGDMDLIPHLWRMAGLGKLSVEVYFHKAVTLSEFGDRKKLAAYCQDVIARRVALVASSGGSHKANLRLPPQDIKPPLSQKTA